MLASGDIVGLGQLVVHILQGELATDPPPEEGLDEDADLAEDAGSLVADVLAQEIVFADRLGIGVPGEAERGVLVPIGHEVGEQCRSQVLGSIGDPVNRVGGVIDLKEMVPGGHAQQPGDARSGRLGDVHEGQFALGTDRHRSGGQVGDVVGAHGGAKLGPAGQILCDAAGDGPLSFPHGAHQGIGPAAPVQGPPDGPSRGRFAPGFGGVVPFKEPGHFVGVSHAFEDGRLGPRLQLLVVVEGGVRVNPEGPTRPAEAVCPFVVLAIHEEGGVEAADGADGVEGHEPGGCIDEADLERSLLLPPALGVEVVEVPIGVGTGPIPMDGRTHLEAVSAVGPVEQPFHLRGHAGRIHLGVLVQEVHGVDVAPEGLLEAAVVAFSESGIGPLDPVGFGQMVPQPFPRPINRSVVDGPNLSGPRGPHGVHDVRKPIQAVVDDHDVQDFHRAGHAPQGTMAAHLHRARTGRVPLARCGILSCSSRRRRAPVP